MPYPAELCAKRVQALSVQPFWEVTSSIQEDQVPLI